MQTTEGITGALVLQWIGTIAAILVPAFGFGKILELRRLRKDNQSDKLSQIHDTNQQSQIEFDKSKFMTNDVRITRLEGKLDDMQKEQIGYIKTISQLEAKNGILENENQHIQREFSTLHSENERLRREFGDLLVKFETLVSKSQTQEMELISLRKLMNGKTNIK